MWRFLVPGKSVIRQTAIDEFRVQLCWYRLCDFESSGIPMIQVFKSILCPVDLEAPSKVAIEVANKLAQQNEAPVCLLHVITLPLEGAAEPSPEWENTLKSRLEEVAREHFADGVQCDIKVVRGEAGSAIIRAVVDIKADLIVMATHRYTGLNRLLLGSVAERVVRESPVPVLAVGPERSH